MIVRLTFLSASANNLHSTSSENVQSLAKSANLGITTNKVANYEIEKKQTKRYFGSITLNNDRFIHEITNIDNEVIKHLRTLKNTNVEITIEISATNPAGFSDDLIRTITENARTLKFKATSFEEE